MQSVQFATLNMMTILQLPPMGKDIIIETVSMLVLDIKKKAQGLVCPVSVCPSVDLHLQKLKIKISIRRDKYKEVSNVSST